jgi:hypothetical protein
VVHEVWARKNAGVYRPDARTDPSFAPQLYREPTDPLWQQAWRVTDGLIGEMNEVAKKGGARFVLTMVSTPIQIDPDPAVRARYLSENHLSDFDYAEKRLTAVAQRDGFAMLDIIPALRAASERDGLKLHGFANATPGLGHWNVDGHRVAGHELATGLCALLSAK